MLEANANIFVSYFDMTRDPKIILSPSTQRDYNEFIEEKISNLMDYHNPGDFFAHYFNGMLTLNCCFSISQIGVRGNQFDLMASMVVDNIGDGEKMQKIFLRMPLIEEELRNVVNMLVHNALMKELIYTATYIPEKLDEISLKAREMLTYSLRRTNLYN